MPLAIKYIQFADEVPINVYFESAPFDELAGPTHLSFAVTVDDDGSGWDFWGQAVLPNDVRSPVEIDGSTGRIAVARLEHAEITEAVEVYLARFEDWTDLRFDGGLIFEDGE
jgi:hypothetical protein